MSVLLALSACMANAAEVWHTSKIKHVYPLADGSFVLTFVVDSPACNNGSTPKYHYVAVGQTGVTTEGLRSMLSTALAAAAAQKTVNIAFDDSTTACYVNRLSVDFSQ